MPLDSHSYLQSQGWSGKGTGLRQGAISRPLAIPQKRTLAGLGKDRDEAFPFWDHLFSAAAKSIQLKVSNDDDDSDNTEESSAPKFNRTSTGILSNRRPLSGTPATLSGTATPDSDPIPPGNESRLSLLASAKREAAKRGLYARFFRGPTLGPDIEDGNDAQSGDVSTVIVREKLVEVEVVVEKKRKTEDGVGDLERREHKRLKKELEKAEKAEKKKLDRKHKDKAECQAEGSGSAAEKQEVLDKQEKKRLKREAKEAAKKAKLMDSDNSSGPIMKEKIKKKSKDRKEKKADKPDQDVGDDLHDTQAPNVEPNAAGKRDKSKITIQNHDEPPRPPEVDNDSTAPTKKKKRKRKDPSP